MLLTTNVPSSPSLVTLFMERIRFTDLNIQEVYLLSHLSENLKSYILNT
jgi:hypothetical protein